MVSFEELEKARSANFRLKQAQELTILAAADVACVKSFTGRWKIIKTKLKLLPVQITELSNSAFFEENILSKELLESLVCSLEEARQLAKLCTDLTYGGKLRMQSNLDALTMKLSLYLGDCQLMINSEMLKETAPNFSKTSQGAGKQTLKCMVKNLLARLQIGSIDSKLKALNALIELMNEDDKNVLLVASQQGASLLVRLLEASVPVMRERAAVAVCSLLSNDYCEDHIVMEEALAPLVRLLESGSSLANEKSSVSLQCLTHTPEHARSIVSQGGIPALLTICRGGTPVAQAAAAGTLRNLCGFSEAIEIMLEAGAIPTLLHLVNSGTTDAQEHAAAILQTVSHNSEPITRLIASEGGIVPVLRYLATADVISGQESGIGIVQNLAAFVGNIEALLCAGIVQQLPGLLTSCSPAVQQATAVIVCDLVITADTIKAIGEAGCIPPLLKMLDAKTRTAQEYAMRALASLLPYENNLKIFLTQENGISRILELLDPLYHLAARQSAVWALTTLAGSSSKCRKQIISAGVYYSLERLAETDLPSAKKLLERLERGRLRNLFKRLDLSEW
ncbi:hypothetical protein O6H91_04G122300 [Diphasiastrum complanatum]|uniref:Uncharacterized protein n=1 Tax=Diphasiastrum complanatum TaxID=34168 RepID=A0ACC2E115_DIPCM|nr:hypothetical protein O6H91_04G122300 [Diphasiastrum complanatum]